MSVANLGHTMSIKSFRRVAGAVALAVGISILHAEPSPVPGRNLLPDAGLSTVASDPATNWKFIRGKAEGEVVWGARACKDDPAVTELFIRKSDAGTHDHCWWAPQIPAAEGMEYHLTFQAKSSGSGDHGVYAGVDFLGKEGARDQFQQLSAIAYASTKWVGAKVEDPANWKTFEAKITIPRGVKTLRLRFGLDAVSPAEGEFRNIVLTMPSVPLASVLEQSPASIPVFAISSAPVSAAGVTLTPDWRAEGAETRRSAARTELCLNGLWAVQPAAAGQPPREGDWGFLKVPSLLSAQDHYLVYGQGRTTWAKTNLAKDAQAIWFLRDVEIPQGEGRGVRLAVSGMLGFSVRAYWNGKAVGCLTDQFGGVVDLSAVAKPGEKGQLALYALAVPPERKFAALMEGGDMVRQFEPGKAPGGRGLMGVFLNVEPVRLVFAAAQAVSSVSGKKLEILLTVPSDAPAADRYGVSVRDAQGQVVLAKDDLKGESRDGTMVLTLPWENPRLWTPDDPHLYQFTVQALGAGGKCLDETLPERFGFRQVEVRGREILLNGKPMRLRPRLGETPLMDGASTRRYFSFFKDLGFNCVIRPAAGNTRELENWEMQSAREYYDIADEMGMMVISYVPYDLASGGQFGDSGAAKSDSDLLFKYLAKNQTSRLANHPSVIAYSGFGAGYWEGINTVNVRPDVWGITPLKNPGVLEKVLSDPGAQKKARAIVQASQKFITDFKRLDPSRPFLSHFDGGEGDGWGIYDYFNWTPVQEWENWPVRWTKEGVMPIGSTEHGLPYPSSFMNHGIPDGNNEPWVTEYTAMRIGPAAYGQEPPAYLEFLRSSYNNATKGYAPKIGAHHHFASDAVSRNPENTQAVLKVNNRAIYRAWRTLGVPMGIEPFGHATQYVSKEALTKGNGDLVADPKAELRTVGGKLDRWYYSSYWPSETMPGLPSAPTGKKPEHLTPLGEVLFEVNRPLLAYIAGAKDGVTSKDHVFWSGENIAKQIALIWDGFHERRLNIAWKALVDGAEIAGGKEVLTLGQGDIRFVPVGFPAPATEIRKTGSIEMTVTDAESGQEVARDRFAFQVHPAWRLTEALKNLNIVLFDPSGASAAVFPRLGFNVSTIAKLSDWKGGDVLVVGRGALSEMAGQSLEAIPQKVPVLVLEQRAQDLEVLGFRAFPARARTVFPIGEGSPIMRGLGAEELCDWRVNPKLLPEGVEPLRDGYNYHTDYYGTVASVTLDAPTRGNFTPLLLTGFDLRETPLLEMNAGGRRWMFAQLSLVDPIPGTKVGAPPAPPSFIERLVTWVSGKNPANEDVASARAADPVAARLLVNLLAILKEAPTKPVSFGVLGGEADLRLAGDLGASGAKKSTLSELGATGTALVGAMEKSGSDSAALAQWVRDGGTAVVLPQEQAFYKAAIPASDVRAAKGSLFSVPEGAAFAGLGAADFHYRQALPVLTFGKACTTASEIQDGKGRWILVGFDPRQLDLEAQPYLQLTFRHQYRALSQILTNLGVPLEKPATEIVDRLRSHPVHMDISGNVRMIANKPSTSEWTKPGFDDASWTDFPLSAKQTQYGDALVRIRFLVPDSIGTQKLVADVGTMDDYDETYLNGVQIGSVNPANSSPDLAFSMRRVYPIPAGLLKPGQENVLAIRAWNRNAESKGWKAYLRGPFAIRAAEQVTPYIGTYKHSDDPYLQHHW